MKHSHPQEKLPPSTTKFVSGHHVAASAAEFQQTCETQDLSLSLRVTCLVASLSQAPLSVHNVHPALPAGPGEVPGQGLADKAL